MFRLISVPYSNNQWVYQWFRSFFRWRVDNAITFHNSKKMPSIIRIGEDFIRVEQNSNFSTDYFLKDLESAEIEKRISWLEQNKHFGLFTCYNTETVDLQGSLLTWWKEFYKDEVIFTLQHKNLWSHFIRYCFFSNMNLPYDKIMNNTRNGFDNDYIKSYMITNKVQIVYKEEYWNSFLKQIRILNDDIGSTMDVSPLWYEDLSREYLTEKFEIESSGMNYKSISRINYLTYFTKEDILKMKEVFNKRYEHELQYYGYLNSTDEY